MIGRVLLAALLAGIVAGLIMSVIQHVRLTPLILEAEKFETASHTHAEGEEAGAHEHAAAEGGNAVERTVWTTLSWSVAGAAFAALMAGVSLLTNIPISSRNGILWGLAGFFCVMLAPAAGLAPELPGMPHADVYERQIWWGGTILATAAGLYLIAAHRQWWSFPAAVFLIALPHAIGAPLSPSHETLVPAGIAASFAANAIAAGAVFWAVLGALLGYALEKFGRSGELS